MQDSNVDQQATDTRSEVVLPSSMDCEALELAVMTGDSAHLQTLLSKWPRQGNKDHRVNSLTRFLVDAIEAKDPSIVELLLAKGTLFNLGHVQLAIAI